VKDTNQVNNLLEKLRGVWYISYKKREHCIEIDVDRTRILK
jgi:hypothetical protein